MCSVKLFQQNYCIPGKKGTEKPRQHVALTTRVTHTLLEVLRQSIRLFCPGLASNHGSNQAQT